MLTLAQRFRAAGFLVFRDAVPADGGWAATSVFHYVREAPRVARGSLLRVLPRPGGGAGRGVLAVTVDLAPTADERAALADACRQVAGGEVELRAVVPVRATATLGVAGVTGDGAVTDDLVERVTVAAPALGGPPSFAALAELSADGAALLAGGLQRGLPVLFASLDLEIEHRLTGVSLRVWCDADAALAEARSAGPGGLRERLAARQIAGVEITGDAAAQADLEKLGNELLERFLADAFLDPAQPDGLKATPDPDALRRLNVRFTADDVLTWHAVPQGFLDPGPLTVEEVRLDDAFFDVLAVQIVCTADLAAPDGPIDKVRVRLRHGETSEFVLDAETPTALFRASVDGERTWDGEVEVWFRGRQEPMRRTLPSSDATVLVLDLDALGTLAVDVALGEVPLDRVSVVVVELAWGDAHETLMLDAARPTARWSLVTGVEAPGPYRWRASFVAGERRVEGDQAESAARRLVVDAPAELLRMAQVEVVSAGDFDGVASIVADLRAGEQTATLTFTAPGQSQVWKPDALAYQVRWSVAYADGTVRRTDWADDDRPLLVARDWLRVEVTVEPRLLDLGATLRAAFVRLSYADDATGASDQATLAFHDRTPQRWRFHVGAPDRRAYRHQLTVVTSDGARREGPAGESRDDILVLEPIGSD